MNPEFQRNLWLELGPRRVLLMIVVLGLVFFAAAVTGGDFGPASLAQILYYLIVVVWGSRNAALSVVGEIRDRTWDAQRLSSLTPSEMMWGKLFGSTIYNWLGGAICLAVLLGYRFTQHDAASVAISLVYYLAVGVISQAAALLASLVAVRRRLTHSRFDIFTYQLVGLIAAVAVFLVWEAADPAGALLVGRKSTETIPWWGQTLDARPFLLASLAIFTAWTLIGCYRLMRLELKMRNGPLVWLAFLAFIGLYVAGFDGWLTQRQATMRWDAVELRLGLALSTYAVLTYLMVLLEPKDRVLYRWLGSRLGEGSIRSALWNLQAWMMSYFAALIVAIALLVRLIATQGGFAADASLLVSGMGCLTRDVSIFVLFQTLPGRRRGDFSAVIVLIALYLVVPYILHGMGLDAGLAYLHPQVTAPLWLGPVVIWAEAIVVAAIAIGRIALSERAECREPALA
jgi:hypothetical protein